MDKASLSKLRERMMSRLDELKAEGDIAIEPAEKDVQKKIDEDAAPLAEMNQVIASNRNRARAQELQRINEALVPHGARIPKTSASASSVTTRSGAPAGADALGHPVREVPGRA